jgi:hypothetical protein
MANKTLEKLLDINGKPAKSPAYPSARYFQVHFEYLQELLLDMRQQLALSNQQMTQLQQQLNEHRPTVSEDAPPKN